MYHKGINLIATQSGDEKGILQRERQSMANVGGQPELVFLGGFSSF